MAILNQYALWMGEMVLPTLRFPQEGREMDKENNGLHSLIGFQFIIRNALRLSRKLTRAKSVPQNPDVL